MRTEQERAARLHIAVQSLRARLEHEGDTALQDALYGIMDMDDVLRKRDSYRWRLALAREKLALYLRVLDRLTWLVTFVEGETDGDAE